MCFVNSSYFGIMYSIAKCVLLLCAAVAASGFALGPQDIVFHLFTPLNSQVSEPLLPNINSIQSSNFLNLSRRTVISIHSYNGTAGDNFNSFMVLAHLNRQDDVNFIAVDWSRGATLYSEGLGNAPQVGEVVASFVNMLLNPFGYDPELITIVGFGLGGHIAGIAARQVNGEIPHIIAIDPSLFGWTHHPLKLNPDDAGVVEVLHATAGIRGYDYPLGDIDFYPNGGASQTGCGTDVWCSQVYAYAFYSESVIVEMNGGNQFIGTKCESYEDARAQLCAGESDAVFGGTESKAGISGIYTFVTNPTSPFARG